MGKITLCGGVFTAPVVCAIHGDTRFLQNEAFIIILKILRFLKQFWSLTESIFIKIMSYGVKIKRILKDKIRRNSCMSSLDEEGPKE